MAIHHNNRMEKIMENSQYYQGVLQLRNCPKQVVDFVRKKAEAEEGASISKEVRLKAGIDLYMTSNKLLKKIGKMLGERYTGITKSSSKLFTRDRQTGKLVYRGTILFKMPNFSVGEEGLFRGDKVAIVSIGNKVLLRNMKTGKKKSYDFDDVEKHFRPA